ncbi:uncharacterized protein LOC125289154 [Alosa alosa]|nr:uncharacterized protein LOC125289154 [Alosa alosa]
MVHWPPGIDAMKAIKEMQKPEEKWRKCPLIKLKLASLDNEECELYNFSTTAEGSDDELPIHSKPKRIGKKKTYDDFVQDDEDELIADTPPNRQLTSEANSLGHGPSLPLPPKKVMSTQEKHQEHTRFHLQVTDSVNQLQELNRQLASHETQKRMTAQMSKIGGATPRENVNNVRKRVLTNGLMSIMNMDGAGDKLPFRSMNLYKVMIGAIQKSQPGTSEASIGSLMANYLRVAPDRRGGTGRLKTLESSGSVNP